jgi:hypothetical protein
VRAYGTKVHKAYGTKIEMENTKWKIEMENKIEKN